MAESKSKTADTGEQETKTEAPQKAGEPKKNKDGFVPGQIVGEKEHAAALARNRAKK